MGAGHAANLFVHNTDRIVRIPTLGWPSNNLSSSELRSALVAMTAGCAHTLIAHMKAQASRTSVQCRSPMKVHCSEDCPRRPCIELP